MSKRAGTWHDWSWFREPGYFVGGMYGRPWALTFQWARGRYMNLDISAPALGDCRIGWTSKSWARESLRYGFSGSAGWDCSRMSWAELDVIEADTAARRTLRISDRTSWADE